MTKTRGIVEAGAEYRTPAGLFQGMTLESVTGPAFEFTEDGQPVQPGHTFGAGVVVVRRAADGNSDDSAFVLTEPGAGTGGGEAGRGIATMTISGGNLTGTYTDGTNWDAGTLPAGPAATVSIGTVTTLAPGAQATVTNSGTSSAAVLDFGIPQGASGAGGTGGVTTTLTATFVGAGTAEVQVPWPALLRKIAQTEAATYAIYPTDAARTSDAARLNTMPTAEPSTPVLVQVIGAANSTYAIGEPLPRGTVYLRSTAATTLTLTIEEA